MTRTRFSLILSIAALGLAAALSPIASAALVMTFTTVSLVAAFWSRAETALEQILSAWLSSAGVGGAIWLALHLNSAITVGLAIAAVLVIGIRYAWLVRSGKKLGPPLRPAT